MREALTFDDVLIVPRFSEVASRKDVDICSNKLGMPYLRVPVISANMDTVTGVKMATAMIKFGGNGCLHRFCTIEENVKMLRESMQYERGYSRPPFVSVGLGKEGLERAEALIAEGARIIVLDVAHGAQMAVVEQTRELKKLLNPNCSVVVGNFASVDTVRCFNEFVVPDAYKIGVGPGSACTTRLKTGVGYPQLSAVMEIAAYLKDKTPSIIADGGMRTPGDIAKALAAGAHSVMLGGMLAGTDETPGQGVTKYEALRDGDLRTKITHKKYRGSASKESYEDQGKTGSHMTTEGESFLVPYTGPVSNVLADIEGGLRSSLSYVGARNLWEFREFAEFVRVTNSTLRENGAHGKS